jgi:chromosome partitioning protein
MPYVMAICQQKGGVGKTTTAAALGACFAERGIRTLAVDLDPQANLTATIGPPPEADGLSAAELLTGTAASGRPAAESDVPGLHVVPSNAAMREIGLRLHRMPEYEFLLRRSLEGGGLQEYAAAVLDCPPSLGPLTICALTAADLAIVPTQCEYYSIHALADMFDLIHAVRGRTNPKLAYRLLITMFDGRGTFHAAMREQLRGFFHGGLLDTAIGFDTNLRRAQAAGLPVTALAPQSRGASQYRELAEELMPYVKGQTPIQTD